MCISLCRSGNMPISMLWSILVSGRGTDGQTNNDRGKDVVPSFLSFLFGWCTKNTKYRAVLVCNLAILLKW